MTLYHVKSNPVADFTGTVTVLNSVGSTATKNATDLVRPSDWNSAHNLAVTLSGNTAGTGNFSATNVVYQGGNNVTLSANTAASVATIVFSAANQTNQTAASGNIAGAGYTSTTQGGSTVGMTNNSAGLSAAWPPFITTYAAQTNQTQASGNIAGVGTTFSGNNVSATINLNSNGLALSLSAPAGGGGGGVTVGGAELFPLHAGTAFSTLGQNSIYFQKFIAQSDVSFNNIEKRVSMSTVSSTNAQNANHTYDYGLYSRGAGASTSIYNLIASSQMVIRASYSSNLSAGFTVSQGAGSVTNTSAGTVNMSALSGFKHLYMPFTSTITAGGEYAVAVRMSSATTGNTGALRIGVKQLTNYSNLSVGRVDVNAGISISNVSRVGDFAQGVYSATSSNLPSTLAISGLTNAVSQARMYIQFEA